MSRHLSLCLCLCLLLPFALAFAPHDDKNNPKSIGNSAPPGIGGDGPWERLNMELLGRLPLDEIGGGQANVLGSDCWGWTDPLNGTEYAICGLTNGTSFIDISDPADPKYLGKLLTQTGNAAWRDMKVYQDHVFVVSDGNDDHGMQVFDLTQLRTADRNNPVTFSNTAWYDGDTGSAHNIAINEDTGFAYIVGSDHPDAAGGLQVVDISNPVSPVHAGVYSGDGYTHDVQVVSYIGPDLDYEYSEIAFASNEDTVTIIDVTDKSNMTLISRNAYAQDGYTHQGWLSEDHRYFFMGDELDENQQGGPTRTHIFDCLDLDNPVYMGYYSGNANSIDHNLYVKGNLLYCGNYSSGLRVLEMGNTPAELTEIAFFDTYNTDTGVNFNGVWSVYPYFDSGTVLVNDRQNGMFLVKLSPISFSFPKGGIPDLVDPDGGLEFCVRVENFFGTAQPGTGVLHVDLGTGNGFETFPMTESSPGLYLAEFPASACASEVRFYVSAQATDGTLVCSPPNAPLDYYTAMSADAFEIIHVDDLEIDLGWTVSGDATDGQWDRGVPAGSGDRGDPSADGDGSGSCFLTDNVDGNSDVDSGSTILTSPVMDAATGSDQVAVISYWRWYTNDAGSNPASDTFVVDISNDGGATWTNLEVVGPDGSEISGGWIRKSFRINDVLAPTSQMQLRFTASDLGNASVVEAAVDGIEIMLVDCAAPVTPLIGKTADGILTGGQLSDAWESNNTYMSFDPEPTANPYKQKIEFIMQSLIEFDTPTEFSMRMESKMLGGPSGDVMQSIEFWNYQTRSFEVLDLQAMAINDTVVEVSATGDLSRFVAPGTREITAMVTFNSFSWTGTPFFWSVEVDELVWFIDQ